jgi:hypothetical protein
MCTENRFLKVKGTVHNDIGPLLADSKWPLINELILELEADQDITRMTKKAEENVHQLMHGSNR